MKKAIHFNLIILFCFLTPVFAQKEKEVSVKNVNGELHGTLLLPKEKKNIPVALIIAGSGPTDRNGNSGMMQNNSLKLLATHLAENGIASLRYDKQGVGKSVNASKPEEELRFSDFVDDASHWIDFLAKNKRFSSIIVIGHSEGALIGKLASQHEAVDKFVSIAGAGRTIDEIILDQLEDQSVELKNQATPVIEQLKQGELVENPPSELVALFRLSVQPYLISWMELSPVEALKSLAIPSLIIQGTTDIQVKVEEAEKLHQAVSQSELVIIEGMNHVFKDAPIDRDANIAAYMDPKLPLSEGFGEAIVGFILGK